MRTSRSFAAVVACFVSSLASTAGADPLPSLDLRSWRPSTDPRAGLILEPSTTPAKGDLTFGAWFNYAHRPITLRRGDSDDVAHRPVANHLGADLTANLGLSERASVGLSIPMVLFQDGTAALPASVSTESSVPSSALGDIGLHGKATLLSNVNKTARAGFGLAALGALTIPTGDRSSFFGNGAPTVSVRALAEYTYVVATVQASLGYLLRTEHRTWPEASLGGIRFGDELPWTLGISLRPKLVSDAVDADDRQTWEIAAHGSLPMGPVFPFGGGEPGSASLSPVMLGLSDRIAIGKDRDLYAVLGVDFGFGSAVGMPAFRGVAAIGWAPRKHDVDDDGVPDDRDECKSEPEDRDGIDDGDGCPEFDADEDTVPDAEDACVKVAGVPQPDPKKNGCPAPDSDGDGVYDPSDACPQQKGMMNDDPKLNGCPLQTPPAPQKSDADGDGIEDKLDACPNAKGDTSADSARNGCPNPDRDGDTFANDVDKCPDEAEVFNGEADDDGCADQGGKALVVIDPNDAAMPVRLAKPMAFVGTKEATTIDPGSVATLRALAAELNRRLEWKLEVGARPGRGTPEEAKAEAAARTKAIVDGIAAFTGRSGIATAVDWSVVQKLAGAESGIALRVVAPDAPRSEMKPAPAMPAAKDDQPPTAPPTPLPPKSTTTAPTDPTPKRKTP